MLPIETWTAPKTLRLRFLNSTHEGTIDFSQINIAYQLTDGLTKVLPGTAFEHCIHALTSTKLKPATSHMQRKRTGLCHIQSHHTLRRAMRRKSVLDSVKYT
jgi:hypothetical protein